MRRNALLLAGGALALAAFACTGGGGSSGDVPPPPDPQKAQRGRQVYLQSCAVCHGPNAEGAAGWQRPNDQSNLPPPPHDDNGHTWRHPDGQLREIILDGQRDRFNKTPDLTMPPFRDHLTEEEIGAVIVYFKSLWSEEHRRYQQEETEKALRGQRGG